ncbi:hypothetical protein BU25DRAFT_135353 [Macroventuria anomochaeta]|uniref:Uncharacterized protein n=1 Tax=Macroventuria anomochaeta TaxID=301207 RepID=A0ACB6SD07_9PLEO|nr:uncharacterized protein BU25DRAFT_135353 [Macroventuria anomochaeta]KAF2631877.1 hypothetical protein BU25DRAFT_135353 [Macroventuria anomochaeta]
MGVVEQAVDAAASFVGPFVDAGAKHAAQPSGEGDLDNARLVREAIEHLQAINTADLAADPDAPYDASLAGVVYGLLDLTASLGILPYLSSGVAFSQRPRSVLIATFTVSPRQHKELLSETVPPLLSILAQKEGTGLQPLLAQRSLPDIISALAELAFSPQHTQQVHSTFEPAYNDLLTRTPTSRLLPILTTFLQQPLPAWLKPRMGKELATVPIRAHGVRHVIEFLSLSYLSKNSQVPRDASGPQSRIPIPLEAVTQASKLLTSPPSGISQDAWIQKLEPQLWSLLDGNEVRELSRAAGQIIAGGILSKRTTGAPGTTGWKIFAQPILETVYPKDTATAVLRNSTKDRVLVQDQDLLLALQRLAVITTSYSHAGLIKRLTGPILLPLWALLNYARSKRSLDKLWIDLPRNIIARYITIACDPKQVDTIATNLFWDGPSDWTFGPGTKGGIETRMRRNEGPSGVQGMESILSRINDLTGRIDLLVSLLADAKVSDDVVGLIFLQVTKRWLSPNRNSKATLLLESDDDPLTALTDAKLSEALASRFRDSFARSPQHIIELMGQLLQNYVANHQARSERQVKSQKPSRANLGSIVALKSATGNKSNEGDTSEDDLVAFAISILNTVVATPKFKRTPANQALLSQITGHLQYLIHVQDQAPFSQVIANSARSLLQVLSPSPLISDPTKVNVDPLASHRTTLQAALQDLTSPEAPNRTWSLSTLHTLIREPSSFPVIDVPRTTHLILSASLADPESYVHSAAIPVLVTLALRAPHPTNNVLVDAFLDVDERSLKPSKGRMTDEKERELQEALDYRLRVGEVLNNVVLADDFWHDKSNTGVAYTSIKHITSACLFLASRRGQRHKTQSYRQAVSLQIAQQQDEAEAAWGGPIPNVFEPDGEASAADKADYEALSKIVKGWEDTGIEEDVRIRASAMSIFGTVLEKRLGFVGQATVDAGLQTALLVLTMETAEAFFMLRRAAVLVVMGLLRALDEALDAGENSSVGLGMKQQHEVERVLRWVRDEDGDELVRDHAASVVDGLETLRMKTLYRVRDEGMKLGPDLGLEGGLRGLNVRPDIDDGQGKRRMVVEEIE